MRWVLIAGVLAAGCDGTGVGPLDAGDPADAGIEETPLDGGVAVDAGAAPVDAGNDAGPMAECPRVRVTTVGIALNVREQPRLDATVVGSLPEGSIVDARGQVSGDAVDGIDTWYEVASPAGFISGRYAECTTDEPPLPQEGFLLPLACGTSARVSQGNNSGFSHTGYSAYAFDFALPLGTTLHAMADGTVSYVYDRTGPGDPCYSGGGPECITKANLVWLRHADGTVTSYAHLRSVLVRVGQSVRAGTAVGRSGSSGYSTGPHAHVARQRDCSASGCQSIPLRFADVPGDGVPETGDMVTSGNCP
ncbi:MAG: peptidoglycan DD-metalloendopeptidase family protein [Sandaracinaceae bacterium]